MDDGGDVPYRPQHASLTEEAVHPLAVDLLALGGGQDGQVPAALGLAAHRKVLLDGHHRSGGQLLGDVGQAEASVPLDLAKEEGAALLAAQHRADGQMVGGGLLVHLPTAPGAKGVPRDDGLHAVGAKFLCHPAFTSSLSARSSVPGCPGKIRSPASDARPAERPDGCPG